MEELQDLQMAFQNLRLAKLKQADKHSLNHNQSKEVMGTYLVAVG